jgi:hypothetical protein
MARQTKRARPANPSERREAEARARAGRSDDADAFIRDPGGGPVNIGDDLADVLAQDFVTAATSGEDVADEDFDQSVAEDIGGPFLESDANEEFARRPDKSNPRSATREPLPTALGRGPYTPEDMEQADESSLESESESSDESSKEDK